MSCILAIIELRFKLLLRRAQGPGGAWHVAGAVVMFAPGTNRRIDVGANSAGAMRADGGEPGVGDQIVFTRLQSVGGAGPRPCPSA